MIIATLAGRLGRDADIKVSQSGMDICTFSVGCDRGYGDKKTTEWVKCILFDKRAKSLHQYLVKGLAVTVTGEAKAAFWMKDGEARGQIEVVADKIVLQSKSDRQNSSERQGGGGETAPADDLGDSIPFITSWLVGRIG